jgi:Tfp pilus assembly protein PilF
MISSLDAQFGVEVRLYNNLGIIQKSSGEVEQAKVSFLTALNKDPKAFYPNYNYAMILMEES